MSSSITPGVAVVRSVLFALTVLFLNLGIFPSANAQIPTKGGRCPIKNPSTAIDIKKITGQWYEIEASPNLLEYHYKCVSVTVPSFFEKTSEISIDAVDRKSKKSLTVQKLSAKIPDSSDENNGKLALTMIPAPVSPEGDLVFGPHLREQYAKLPIQILATDYNNWALVWMCKSHAGAHTELVWILSRERTLTEDQYKAIQEAKESYNLGEIETKDTIQWGCSKQEQDDELEGKKEEEEE